ncbi:chemotaxis protein CheR [Paraburkholderia monticola]|uniref:Chemotaxis protein CheR n=1 Tax=Paraburkholderia monticola TaxID=1399968 RepID=A0A149PXP7_9BURK|nr:protein-glutamate O-methyltransferase CheR [Paraburkholderia monticola]KXU89773.1 chemotaxis protein CheR [Paraburkholderia monticola]
MNAHHDNVPLYRHFTGVLQRTMGLDPSSLGHRAVERAVDQHAAAWCADGRAGATLADYWNAVQTSPALLQALIESLTVPETWFFRDADAFRALARLARERLDERIRTRAQVLPLRILSLPCSSGEEPYTIAMTLLDAGLDAAQFRIDAMDINERSLAAARRAHYGRNSFRGNALAFRNAHFSRAGDGWLLAPRVVETVRFSHANLTQLDTAALGVYDFVFCRNVLIYFNRDTQQIALQALDSVLADGGTMFVGPAETGLLMRYGMQSAKIPLAFAFHRASPEDAQSSPWHTAPLATAAALAMTPAPALAPAPVYSAEPFAWPDPVARNAFDAYAPQRTAPDTTLVAAPSSARAPSPPPQRVPQTDPANGTRVDTLRAAHALADAGRLDEAATALNAYLEQHAPHADAFYLLGVLADANGETDVARAQYRKAIYLDPRHTEALAHLATLLELEGDRDGARLLKQRALRAQGATRA